MLDTGWAASVFAVVSLAIAVATAAHALLQRRDTGMLIAWVGLIFLLPLAGSILYWLFGVNRIRRRRRAGNAWYTAATA